VLWNYFSVQGCQLVDFFSLPGSSQKLRFTKAQLRVLEETFERLQRPNAHQKSTLATELGVQPRQVEVWFQNRRARGKAKRNESDCEVLRQRCQDLIVENHHLNYLIQVNLTLLT
jgi:homeobox-leucine zipper protein